MTPDIIDKLQAIFTPVAEKIGEGAQFGWTAVVKQMYVYAALGVFWAIIGLIAFSMALYLLKWAKAHSEDTDGASYMVPFFIGVAGIIAFTIGASVAITHYLNPEYYAIQFFIGLATGNN